MKRVFDIVTSSLGLIMCLPLFLIVSLLIKLESPGPIFFKQVRMGRGFRTFSLYKFRTMALGPPTHNGGLLTVGQDPRITRLGKHLRKYKIDELPQLINICKGEMSVVGPRPQTLSYVEVCKEKYREILTIRPGLTDFASIQYIDEQTVLEKSHDPEKEYRKKILPEKLILNSRYLQHASFLLDLAIITQTLLYLLGVPAKALELSGLEHPVKEGGQRIFSKIKAVILKCRRPLLITLDLCLIVLANYIAFILRFDGNIPDDQKGFFFQMLPWLIVLRGMAFFQLRFTEGLWKYTSIWDLQRVVSGVLISTLAFYALVRVGFGNTDYSTSVIIMDSLMLIGFCVGARLSVRLLQEKVLWREKKKVVILGAGDVAERIVREIKAHPSFGYEPIGFLDDNPIMVGQRIHGVRVLGNRNDLSRIIVEKNPQEIWVALPEIKPTTLREIVGSLESFKVIVKVLPDLKCLLENRSIFRQVRKVSLEDMLPRTSVVFMPEPLRHIIAGKRILITGPGGAIGAELCRQVLELQPDTLVLYDRHVNRLDSVVKELGVQGHSCHVYPIIGDVTDSIGLRAIVEEFRPHIMLHAATYTNESMVALNPGEALKNNCLGTRIAAEAAEEYGVERFILISTDKAVNPSSVMGATHRVAELVIKDMALRSKTHFLTVRLGSILKSSGSVIARFQEQIEAGATVTVTHPQVRRYFMLITEAGQLILQATALGEQGAIYVFDPGEQVKVIDLARNLIRLSGFIPEVEIPISFVGLRPGEKLYEELVGADEKVEPSSVARIYRVKNGQHSTSKYLLKKIMELEEASALQNPLFVIKWLQEVVPTFHPTKTQTSVASSAPLIERAVSAKWGSF